jgi:seryl-tRNA synthetase
MSNFKAIVERIRTLDTERRNLMLEVEELKKMADSKAKALESEIGMLREEVKSLRVLLGAEEEPDLGQKKRK